MAKTRRDRDQQEQRHREEYVAYWRRFNRPAFGSCAHDFATACMAALFVGMTNGITGDNHRSTATRNADLAAEARAFAAAWDDVRALRDAERAAERAEAGPLAAAPPADDGGDQS